MGLALLCSASAHLESQLHEDDAPGQCPLQVVRGHWRASALQKGERLGFRGKGRGLTSLGPSGKKSPGSVTLMVSGWDQ